jgi:Ulp1 family protease
MWLDDESLMVSIRVLLLDKRNCFSFGTHFFQKACLATGSPLSSSTDIDLNSFKYGRVKKQGARGAPNGDIFELEHVFFPINIRNNHWTLLYLNMKRKTMYYYDSCYKPGNISGMRYMEQMVKYLEGEHKAIKGTDLPRWMCMCPENTMGPSQSDDSNCGVFVTFVIDAIVNLKVHPEVLFLNDQWNFSSEDMNQYRRRMAASILKKAVPGIPDLPEWKDDPVIDPPIITEVMTKKVTQEEDDDDSM